MNAPALGYIVGGSEQVEIADRFRRHEWGAELTMAEEVARVFGGEVSTTDAAHQVAKIVGADFRVVIYPHRTSARNYHLRVRDEGSKNRQAAERLMIALDHAAGFNCTFSRKRGGGKA